MREGGMARRGLQCGCVAPTRPLTGMAGATCLSAPSVWAWPLVGPCQPLRLPHRCAAVWRRATRRSSCVHPQPLDLWQRRVTVSSVGGLGGYTAAEVSVLRPWGDATRAATKKSPARRTPSPRAGRGTPHMRKARSASPPAARDRGRPSSAHALVRDSVALAGRAAASTGGAGALGWPSPSGRRRAASPGKRSGARGVAPFMWWAGPHTDLTLALDAVAAGAGASLVGLGSTGASGLGAARRVLRLRGSRCVATVCRSPPPPPPPLLP
jgi:hypothetical protein